jgi:serine O-acetyltransferase
MPVDNRTGRTKTMAQGRRRNHAGKDSLPAVVDAVLDRLQRRDTVQHVCQWTLPSEEAVIGILDLLAEALFPGYFGKKALNAAGLSYHVGEVISTVYDLLSVEVTRCLIHEWRGADDEVRADCEGEGRGEAFRLLQGLPDLLDVLDDDVHAAFEGDPAATGCDEVVFCYPGFRAVMIQRIAHRLHRQGVPWLPRIMTEYAHRITGIDIHPGAEIGRRFFIDHGTGVVIGETRILGDITVGKGSVIGANVILTESVPPGTQVTIEPPRQRFRQREQ